MAEETLAVTVIATSGAGLMPRAATSLIRKDASELRAMRVPLQEKHAARSGIACVLNQVMACEKIARFLYPPGTP